MNISESNTVIALLRHLDGSQVLDETDLASDLLTLAERAFKTLECAVTIDQLADRLHVSRNTIEIRLARSDRRDLLARMLRNKTVQEFAA